jgi:hypothetical protein
MRFVEGELQELGLECFGCQSIHTQQHSHLFRKHRRRMLLGARPAHQEITLKERQKSGRHDFLRVFGAPLAAN